MSTANISKLSRRSAIKAGRKVYMALYKGTERDYADQYRRRRNGYLHELDFLVTRRYLHYAHRSAQYLVNHTRDPENRRLWLRVLSQEKSRVRKSLAEIKEDRLSGKGLWRPIGGDTPFPKGGLN